MGNHSGSRMLNRIIRTTKDLGILKAIGKETARKFVLEIIKTGEDYDCNAGEIVGNIEDIIDELGLCSNCLEASDDVNDGLCKKCRG